mmetsp:Transcript_109028/g.326101  ORF Transcript_109028/g.326101 Transcript_109028/m.326101 type:complete len:460 (-) Transcript_109028:33-1412(-)
MLRVGGAPLCGLLGRALRPRFSSGAVAGTNITAKPRVVILGTGWASFRVVSDLDASKYDIAVVSPRNHLLFTPMLASSALGTVNQRSICQPVRPVVMKKNGNYYESRAKQIDREAKQVLCETASGDTYRIPYDKLVVGVGFQPNDFNIPGVKEHALFMKETADATVFKDHVLARLEEASYVHALDSDLTVSPEEEARIKELLTFIIIGGGPTGVELAAELTDFLQSEGNKMYPRLSKHVTVHMLTYDVLNMFDKELQEYTIHHLGKKQGVHVHLGAFVQQVTEKEVTIKTGEELSTFTYGTLVWCAGIKPHSFIKDYGFQMNERGTQILVDESLRVKGEEDIFALGDCAAIDGYWVPQTAQVANQQGQHLASDLNNQTMKPFKFRSKGTMAYLGSNNAIMSKLPGLRRLTGFFAFVGWRFTYWFLQLSIRNRFMLSTDWLRTIVFGRDLTRFGPRSRPE